MLRANKFLTFLVLVALLASACQPIVTPESMEIGMAGSTELDAALADETVAAIRQIVEERMAQVQAPGFAVAVVRDGTMVYAEGFGVAELGTARPVTPQTVFQLASTSKPITAIAIMQLAEANKLQLDAPITEYLPYFQLADERYRDITIEQILTHRSGLPEGGGFLGAEAEIVPEFDEGAAERYVRGLVDLELLFAPGTDWAYSDMGYNILGDVIAKVSGLSFEAYAQQHIFTPLGMAQTTFLLAEVPTTTLALPHALDENGEMASTGIQPYTRPLAPSDTLFSSVIDMSRLAIASLNHGELDGVRILSAESWQQMWTVQTETWFGDLLDYLAPEYAYGWYWGDVAGQPVVHHPGTELGYQNIFLLAPEENLAVITMGNALAADENFFYAMAIGQEVLKALLGAQPTETAATELPVPRFEPSDCKYPVLADTDAECGYLVVREDRSNPDSPTIRVHVIKYPSTSATPAPDPLIGIPGGPGASGDFYAWLFGFSPAAEAWRAERDVFALETRGAMYSEPAFYCPETEADWSEFVGMSMAEEVAWTAEAYRACHDRLLAGGVNFSAYGFLDIAGDIADLRSALGFEKVNVYGVSYGTTPAMLVMRDSPEWLRSVTLDSIIPPDIAYLEHTLENTTIAINNAIAACAADAICNAAYPNLESVFAAVLTQLRQEPAVVTINDEEGVEHIVTVDDVKFVHFLYDSIFIGDGFTTVPAGIYAAYQGDLQAPAKIWLSYIAGQHGPATAQAGAWAKGMTYAAMCLQDGSVTDLATATAIYDAVDTLPSLRDWGVTHMLGEWLAPCEYWAVTPADPNIATAPVASDVPTLLLGGIFDPEAPPAISVAAAEGFSHSFFYELPAGHGLLLMDCAIDLMTQFLADPTVAPDASCIDAMTPNWVLPE